MKNFFKVLYSILMIVSIVFITGCVVNNDQTETIEIIDMVGDKVMVKKNPTKVACVSRTSYDLLVAFGLEDYIDGTYEKTVDNQWTQVLYPNSSKHFKYDYEPSYEVLLSRGVDLVFAPEKRIAEAYREHGITALTISLYGNPTFDDYLTYISNMVTTIWDGEDIKTKAAKWESDVTAAINEIQNELSKHNLPKEKLYYVRGDKDRGIGYTDTKGSFVEYAYRVLGFDCMSSILESDGNKPSAEYICEFNPDVIVMGGIYQNKHVNDIKTTEPYTTLESVKNNRIYTIPIGFTQMEQVNIFTAEFFYDQANKLYPNIFNYDVNTMLKESIKEWFNVELSDIQIQYMLTGLGPDGEEMY
jgi:iron complex transport system substrate-binding protein